MAATGVLPLFASVCINTKISEYQNIKITQYVMNIFTNLFHEVETYGPIVLGVLPIYLLWDKNNLFYYYIVGFFISAIVNLALKGLLQLPRPSEDTARFNLALDHGRRFVFKSGLPYDVFGMPSGHAQLVFYSTTFIYLSLRNQSILYAYLFISLLTISQRVAFNYHTPLQVIVGAMLGVLMGYLVYNMARTKIAARISEKLDDFGPI
jgi:membrane-associated phospholipid phosphatase